MLVNKDNEDDGSISRLTDNDQENTDLEINHVLENNRKHDLDNSHGLRNNRNKNSNRNQIYQPRYADRNRNNHPETMELELMARRQISDRQNSEK